MANTILSLTRKQIRQAILGLVNSMSPYQVITGYATTGGSTTVLPSVKLMAVPQTDTTQFVGSLLYLVAGTAADSTPSLTNPHFVTAFDPTTGQVTMTPAMTGTPDATTQYELYTSGRWSRDQVEQAIDSAFWDGMTRNIWQSGIEPYAFESNLTYPVGSVNISSQITNLERAFRPEYPIPTQFRYLSRIDYDRNRPVLGWGESNWGAPSGVVAANTAIGITGITFRTQAPSSSVGGSGVGGIATRISVNGNQQVQYMAAYLMQPAGADTTYPYIGASIMLGTGGSPTTTIAKSQLRLTADITEQPTLVVFKFPNPITLSTDGLYYLVLTLANSAGTLTNTPTPMLGSYPTTGGYTQSVTWAYDNTGSSGNPTLILNGGTGAKTWSVVSAWGSKDAGCSLIWYLYDVPDWKPFNDTYWTVIWNDAVQRVGDAESQWPMIHFMDEMIHPDDGTLMRMSGARAALPFDQSVATDSSVPEVEPMFIVYKAASILASQHLKVPGMTPDDVRSQAAAWDQSAERLRRPFILPAGASRKVR